MTKDANVTHETVGEYPPERVGRILVERNVGGKVPVDIFWRILDDMAFLTTQMESWSCATYQAYGMHHRCQREVHTTLDPRRRSAA